MEQEPELIESTHTSKKRHIVVASVVGGSLLAAALLVMGVLTHGPVKSEYKASSVAVNEPIKIKVNQRLLAIPLDKISVSPEVNGKWQLERSFTEGDSLTFVQDSPLIADTEYTVTFNEVKRVTGLRAELPTASFTTEAAPGIENVSFDEGATLAADASFRVVLSDKNRNLRDLELKTTPAVSMALAVKDDTVFEWKTKSKLLPQGKELKVELIDRISKTTLIDRKVKVASMPQLSKKPRETNYGQYEKAELVFNQPIDKESGKINFSVKGHGEWTNDTTYVFTPEKVNPATTYTYTIPEGLRSKAGGIIDKKKEYSFSTPGTVTVTSLSPTGSELSQVQQVIRVGFNQSVDKKSAEKSVSISRGTVRSMVWEGNTLAITAGGFGVQETVGISVRAGIKPIFGLPSNRGFNASFTTEIPVKKLGVPMFYQQYAQSCEAASARMALAYKGAGNHSDWSILQRFGYKPRSLDKKKNIWDDPQKQFVGDVKGSQGKGTGWGVYAEPVAKTIRSYGRGATVRYGVDASFLASNIHKGNPVILWGIWDESAVQKTWKTPDGRTVSGPIPMHVRLVIGVKGKPDKPVGFYVYDPITGPTYWTADYTIYNTRRAGAANQAVAVQ